MDQTAMIHLQDVHKSFGSNHVLRGFSMAITKGEIVCIVGPSGSGKSTVLRCINGLESYEGGSIHVNGTLVDNKAKSIVAIRQNVSMVFQRFNLFPHRSVLDNVTEGPVFVKGEDAASAQKRGRELLARVGLSDKENAFPRELSGGQQQRVAIARALAMEPQVMRDLAREGMTMIIVTHEIAFAREVADRVIFMDQGVIVEQGPARETLAHPSHPRTQDFLRRVTHPIETD